MLRAALIGAAVTSLNVSVGYAATVPVEFTINQIYSSVYVFIGPNSNSTEQSFLSVDDVGPEFSSDVSVSLTSSIGTITTTQIGQIEADAVGGTISASGSHSMSVDMIAASSFARSQGKHIVVGSFVVPDFGLSETLVNVGVSFASSDQGQALFLSDAFGFNADFGSILFGPTDYTSWSGISEDWGLTSGLTPGQIVNFAFGIEPGTGIFLTGASSFSRSFSDSVNATFSLTATVPSPVPLPASALLLLTGVAYLAHIGRRRMRHT